VRDRVRRWQDLDAADEHPDHGCPGHDDQCPPPSALAGAKRGEGRQRDRVPPHRLREPDQERRPEDQRHRREGQLPLPSVLHDQHVRRAQQPRQVGDDGDHVDVMVVEQHEAAEAEQHGPEERRHRAEPQPAEEPPGAGERRDVVRQQLEVERGLERAGPVEQQVQRVEDPRLTFAVEVEAGEDGRRPEQAVALLERLLIHVAERQVEPGQVVVDEDAALEERPRQRQQQRGAADQDEEGQPAAGLMPRDGQRVGLYRRYFMKLRTVTFELISSFRGSSMARRSRSSGDNPAWTSASSSCFWYCCCGLSRRQ
jgi:hypothetical protein